MLRFSASLPQGRRQRQRKPFDQLAVESGVKGQGNQLFTLTRLC